MHCGVGDNHTLTMGKKSKRKSTKSKVTEGLRDPTGADNVDEPGSFVVGDHVVLKGLKAVQYKGKRGEVVSLPKPTDVDSRYGILVEGNEAPIAIRPRNISLIEKHKSEMSTEQLRGVRDDQLNLKRHTEEESMNANQLAIMRMMMGECR